MNKLKQLLGLAAVAALVSLTAMDARAQAGGGGGGGGRRGNRGNFDPAQMRQARLDRAREQLEVTSDDDWKVIGDRVGAVIDAETEMAALRSRGGGPGGRGGRNRGGNNGNADTANNGTNGNGQQANNGGNRRGGFGAPSPEIEALQKAIEANAPADEIKAALAKLHDLRKSKQAKLESAQEELRKVLSVRQEGQAVLAGLLS